MYCLIISWLVLDCLTDMIQEHSDSDSPTFLSAYPHFYLPSPPHSCSLFPFFFSSLHLFFPYPSFSWLPHHTLTRTLSLSITMLLLLLSVHWPNCRVRPDPSHWAGPAPHRRSSVHEWHLQVSTPLLFSCLIFSSSIVMLLCCVVVLCHMQYLILNFCSYFSTNLTLIFISSIHLHLTSPLYPTPPPHRDSFGNVLDLLDDLFERASLADVSERTPCHADNDSYINSLFANLIMWYW